MLRIADNLNKCVFVFQGKFSDSVEKMIEEASEFSIQHLQNKDDIEDFRSSVSINSLKEYVLIQFHQDLTLSKTKFVFFLIINLSV